MAKKLVEASKPQYFMHQEYRWDFVLLVRAYDRSMDCYLKTSVFLNKEPLMGSGTLEPNWATRGQRATKGTGGVFSQ